MTGSADTKLVDQALLNPADPSLTLAAKKLAGSAQCLNCGTELKGPFCYYCGQPDRNFMRFFPALLRDLMEDLLDPEQKKEIEQVIAEKDEDSAPFVINEISFNDKPWDRETNPVDIKWLPDWLNERINDEVEHLIFSLHNHAFIFASLILLLLIGEAGDLLSAYGQLKAATGAEWLVVAIAIWIPLYLLISLRVVYQQNWFMTLGKYFIIGISYTVLLMLVTTGVAIAGFVLL